MNRHKANGGKSRQGNEGHDNRTAARPRRYVLLSGLAALATVVILLGYWTTRRQAKVEPQLSPKQAAENYLKTTSEAKQQAEKNTKEISAKKDDVLRKLTIPEEINKLSDGEKLVLYSEGAVYLARARDDKAKVYAQKALEIFRSIDTQSRYKGRIALLTAISEGKYEVVPN